MKDSAIEAQKAALKLFTKGRREIGYSRSECSCSACVKWCSIMPGYLIPSDLARLIPSGMDPYAWARENLAASSGALVSYQGKPFRVPTLVPQRRGRQCVNLTSEGRCAIWENAPFGCAFFSCKDTAARAVNGPLAKHGIMAVIKAWQAKEPTLYARLWAYLAYKGIEGVGSAQGNHDYNNS